MTHHTDADGGRTSDRRIDGRLVGSIDMNGRTVIFDANDAERWIQSGAAVPLDDVA